MSVDSSATTGRPQASASAISARSLIFDLDTVIQNPVERIGRDAP